MEKQTKLYVLLGLYVGSLYASNLLGGKLMPFYLFGPRGLSVGIMMLPFLFLITDIVGEVYGKKEAKKFVTVGLVSLLVLLAWQFFSISVPAAVPSEWYNAFNPAYQTVFGLSLTFTIASIIAFIIGQHIDVAIYHFIKKLMHKRSLWIRNNISTAIAQFMDAFIWTTIAFIPRMMAGTYTLASLFTIVIIPYYLARLVMGIFHTPLCYLGVWWLNKK
jgi:queuosine precursor transporter